LGKVPVEGEFHAQSRRIAPDGVAELYGQF
jgi:hypothetical protein